MQQETLSLSHPIRIRLGHGVEALYEEQLLVLHVLLGGVHLLPERRSADGLGAGGGRAGAADAGLLQADLKKKTG